jgi:large subunit ribosomal protein L17
MRNRRRRHHLGRPTGHREATLRNLATALFRHESIRTTVAKAKALRPYAEPLITLARSDELHNRRLVLREIHDKEIVRKLFNSIGPRFIDRPGGYTRIIRTSPRPGDGAPMAYIELVVKQKIVEDGDKKKEKKGLIQRVLGRR